MTSRIAHPGLAAKVTTAEQAASFIDDHMTVGMSGFTGSGYPKAVPMALARRIAAERAAGRNLRVKVWTGASTGPELDGALAEADGIELRLPYNSDPTARERINKGEMEYLDMHLSQVAPMAWEGFLGPLDIAVIEVSGINADGSLIPSSSVGNNKTWLDRAHAVILEVNSWQNPALDGMHDIYYGTALPPNRVPIPLVRPDDRFGQPSFRCDPDKVIAVVETDAPDRNLPFAKPDETALAIAGHIIEFFKHEVGKGRLPPNLLPLQSGVGNIANAVLAGLLDAPFTDMTAYTEVLQDGMLDLLASGKLRMASCTAFSLSPDAAARLNAEMAQFRDRIILRPQEMSNHPELVRRLGCLAMNGLIEADIYGNVNSTHIMGSRIQNGIGGSGDFARNAYLSIFMTPSTAKGGKISSIVPHVSHVDHIAQDVQVIVTEQGLADLRGLAPRRRAELVIEKCAHPEYREMLRDYYARALKGSYGLQTPMLCGEALAWHQRFLETGSMLP
ncbi:acetyl-CoA hydrolase/transferase family protein [Sphingomonas sp. HITSZ_GF]|uniref:acetyl-CoA hydrolase/transferase family protein n=1 Tax=Sphingomonas sp. HITSZ_GF TaxID=3037247 RepID=UPI00240CF48F|nr:acetyl-CoA hydrolase/transferase family protein [Sphingomonas sp. HITSZ_GF]MDG2534584.1 acetyl-CoA hydrolase/transferase family protein [Sphingomonas sp. HITSZ_GF]